MSSSPSKDGVPDHHVGTASAAPRQVSPECSQKTPNYRWRTAHVAIKASWRFRIILSRGKDEDAGDCGFHGKGGKFRPAIHVVVATNRLLNLQLLLPDGIQIRPDELQKLQQEVGLDEWGGPAGLSKVLKSDVTRGIEEDPAATEKRRAAYGRNEIPSEPAQSFWMFVMLAWLDPSLMILTICAVVSFASDMSLDGPQEGWCDGVSLTIALTVVIFVTASSEYTIDLQLQFLSQEQKNVPVVVIREGRPCPVSIFDIVVGDIVVIKDGDRVPADGVLVSGQSLIQQAKVELNADMGGETRPNRDRDRNPIHTNAKQPFLFSGSYIIEGYGTMLVIAVGINTKWGREVSSEINVDLTETDLQRQLNEVADMISEFRLIVSVVVFAVLFILFFSKELEKDRSKSSILKWALDRFTDIVAIIVTIFAVREPKGLHLAVTMRFAYAIAKKKMMHEKVLFRKLAASETMGSVTTICCDKAGTITLNQMSVKMAWVANKLLEPKDFEANNIPNEVRETLLVGLCQNTSGSVFLSETGGEAEVLGSPTECAVLDWGLQIGMDYEAIKRSTSTKHVELFNPKTKRSGVVLKRSGDELEAHWKGEAGLILGSSGRWVDEYGSVRGMTKEKTVELSEIVGDMAAKSLRCIALAYRPLEPTDVPDEEENLRWEIPSRNLTLICVIGIEDCCRVGISQDVATCKAAGIKVRMVTGDSIHSAKAVARECGILTEDEQVVKGSVFRDWDEVHMHENLPGLEVLAEALPSDKLLLVQKLKESGQVVAVTGDCTSDTDALKEADVGVAVGDWATASARNSSDMVIFDDPLRSILKEVQWGRSVFTSMQKLIQFQVTVSVVVLFINVVAAVAHGSSFVTPVQLLWLNFITDRLGTFALATEAPTDDLMRKDPVQQSELITSNVMWRNVFTQVLYQIAVLMTIEVGGKMIFKLEGKPEAKIILDTIVFNVAVLCQVFNKVNSRRLGEKNTFQGVHQSPLFLGTIIIELMLQILIVQFFGKFSDTKALTWEQWLGCIAIGFGAWPIALVSKFCPHRGKPYVPIGRRSRHEFFSFADGSRFAFFSRREGPLESNGNVSRSRGRARGERSDAVELTIF